MSSTASRGFKRFIPLAGMLIFPLLGWLYALMDHPVKHVYSMVTDLDKAIPFIKAFILPYSLWIFYIYACLIYFFIKDPKLYMRCLKTYTLCALICYGIYMIFQTTVPRPSFGGSDPITHLLSYIYHRDRPFNCFPSIHCFSSYMVMKGLYSSRFRNRINRTLIYGMSSLIICSTLFVKQHAIMDVLAGIMLAEWVYRMFHRLDKERVTAKSSPSRGFKSLDF